MTATPAHRPASFQAMVAETTHRYEVEVEWTGNDGQGTSAYRAYRRDHEIRAAGVTAIACSSDPLFRGDPTRWNPELLLVASLAQCHMLWYLHLAAEAGIIVESYCDSPEGIMQMNPDGSGQFVSVTLHPEVSVAEPGMTDAAATLHETAHRMCFIARSVAFPVDHRPVTRVGAVS